WDLQTGKLAMTLVGSSGRVDSFFFLAEGKAAVATTAAGEVRVWDVATGEVLLGLGAGQRILNAEGRHLAWREEQGETIHVWDAVTGRETGALRSTGRCGAVAVRRDGKLLAMAREHDPLGQAVPEPWAVKLWDVAAGKETATWPWPDFKNLG